MTKTQIDRLGARLKQGAASEADLRLLDAYRRSFLNAYETVVGRIRDELGLEPTGRPAKSTTSIQEKLRRESIRLTQIQDIAGCRVTVGDIGAQDLAVARLREVFENGVDVVDRRERPSYGYRAVHIVVRRSGKPIEVQVRTSLQHLWAELSEKLSDVMDPSIKYGGGVDIVREALGKGSEAAAGIEELETDLANLLKMVPTLAEVPPEVEARIAEFREKLASSKTRLVTGFAQMIAAIR